MPATGTRFRPAAARISRLAQRVDNAHGASVAALVVYAVAAYITFGRGLFAADTYAGTGPVWDPSGFAWAMAWWPFAISHGLDPLHTTYLWSGTGYDLVWVTSVPLPALVAWPLTAIWGPVVSYDLTMLAAPVLTAQCTFLLCRHITRSFLASLVGGYLFGFSAFTMAHYVGHLNMIMIWTVPLAAYLAVRWFDGSLATPRYVVLQGLVIAAEFGISVEVAATMTLVAALVGGAGIRLLPAYRERLIALAGRTVAAYAVAGVVVAPLLIGFLTAHTPRRIWNGRVLNADLLGTVVPMPTNRLGRHWFAPVARTFLAQPSETGSYIGVAAVLMLIVVIARRWRTPLGVALGGTALAATVLSFGPYLRIASIETMPMPGLILSHLPLIGNAIPARYAVYATLAAAVAVAIFVADTELPGWIRLGFCAAALALALPNLAYPAWRTRDPYGAVFRTTRWRLVLPAHPVVLVLPMYSLNPAMAWQAQTAFGFRLAGGYTPTVPPAYAQAPFVGRILDDTLHGSDTTAFASWLTNGAALQELRACLRQFAINAIIVAPQPGYVDHPWQRVLDQLGARKRVVDGLIVYSGWPHVAA